MSDDVEELRSCIDYLETRLEVVELRSRRHKSKLNAVLEVLKRNGMSPAALPPLGRSNPIPLPPVGRGNPIPLRPVGRGNPIPLPPVGRSHPIHLPPVGRGNPIPLPWRVNPDDRLHHAGASRGQPSVVCNLRVT